MAKYLDDTGLATVWAKVKERDLAVQTAAANDATSKANAVGARVTTIEGYFDGNGKALEAVKATQDGDGAIISSTYVKNSTKGVANGVASLGADGKVPSTQLPAFVDDVIEGYYYQNKFYSDSAHTTEITGEAGKIYVDLPSNKTYRWGGTTFVVISETIAIGTTTGTAYDGGLGAGIRSDLDSHTGNTSNPHSVTKAQVGLGSVVNTGDSATPTQNGTTKFTTGGAYVLQQSIPTTYIKNASVSGSTLTITKQDDTTITFSDTDTGATSVNNTGSGNAVTSISYDATTRKLTASKSRTFMEASSLKTINTTNTTSQATAAAETMNKASGVEVINLHKISKTGSYNDLLDTPTIPVVEAITSAELDEILV
jgi:hypothetical protein